MSKLSPAARRRSLRLQLERIQRKIDKTQEELQQLEQQQSDDPLELFRQGNPGVEALRDRLKHLQKVAEELSETIRKG